MTQFQLKMRLKDAKFPGFENLLVWQKQKTVYLSAMWYDQWSRTFWRAIVSSDRHFVHISHLYNTFYLDFALIWYFLLHTLYFYITFYFILYTSIYFLLYTFTNLLSVSYHRYYCSRSLILRRIPRNLDQCCEKAEQLTEETCWFSSVT